MERQRAKLKYQEAELTFKEAEARIWPEFNRRRSELRLPWSGRCAEETLQTRTRLTLTAWNY